MSDGFTDGWRAAAKAADVTLEVPGGGPMFFRRVPAGEFWMGSRDPYPGDENWTQSELPRHRVVGERGFWMATFPVTQRQLDAWVTAEGFEPTHHFQGHPQRPAENMDWHQAARFCAWLGAQEGWREFRPALPGEVEWEYACRAGSETEYCSGDGDAALAEVGWFDGNSDQRTHDVGELQPNAWGLYDMHGNVWEWCRDRWLEAAYRERTDGVRPPDLQATEPDPEDSQADRVIRGGSWGSPAWWCRSAFRCGWRPGNRYDFQGFRVCLLPGLRSHPAKPEKQPGKRERRRPPTRPSADDLSQLRAPPVPRKPAKKRKDEP